MIKPDPATSAGLITITTWNVNSVKARLEHLLGWLREDKPDIVLLQELKCVNDAFPALEIEDLGYNLALHGEKTYNGVAILSKFPLEDIKRGLPGNETDIQARYVEAIVSIPSLRGSETTEAIQKKNNWIASSPTAPHNDKNIIRVASVYVPNGQDTASDKFQYKLAFLDRLYERIRTLLTYGEMLVIGGDYNIAPDDSDVHDPKAWEGTVLTHDEVRKRFRKIAHLGIYDAAAILANTHYTWWDYRNNAFARDDGLRIDHLLLSPQAADHLESCHVKKELRALDKASDHAPVVAGFALKYNA